jgi:hypothetical protein
VASCCAFLASWKWSISFGNGAFPFIRCVFQLAFILYNSHANKHYPAFVSHSRMWKTQRAIHEKKLYHRAPPWRAKLAALPKVLAALSTHSMTKQEFLYLSICRKDNKNWFKGSPPSLPWRQQRCEFCCARLHLYLTTYTFNVWILLIQWRDFRNPLSNRQAYIRKWGRGLCEELFRDGLSIVYPYYIINPWRRWPFRNHIPDDWTLFCTEKKRAKL